MPTTRIAFQELPPAVIAAVERHTGPILKVEPASEGFNSEVAARVFTENDGCFVKGMRSDHRRIWTQWREIEVSRFLTDLAPELLWHAEEGGWNLLGFELLEGCHADYSPGSPDLPKVADLLRRLSETPCPGVELRQAEQRLESYAATPTDLDFFAGNALLHTDLNNANVLVDDSARLVDWAWATRGAPWLDAGYWVIWLMAAGGHTPESAEQWASHIPTWRAAPSAGLTAFAVANAAMWQEIGGDSPDPWTDRLVIASRDWARYRSSL
ncbi:aminoglycoside phosphotransferase [Streptomyces sp. JJ38]|uniref:aminoglycoside phosphotransferase n=1 Tax=Streptomyces sp. JJ38 TaxID=2738128 RepID=UPI001C570B78|nr:aminoglycoside phosphotransferase [Streptomyces sp. JJ38]MBW1595707.1 aminoglycoside phosphotransferase [Streptomyces sp. JJ38]